MRIVLAYDDALTLADVSDLPGDAGAEYESPVTLERMLEALRRAGHEAVGLVLTEDFPARIRELKPDLVYNVAEGVRGAAREAIVPAWLDHLGVPYTGSDGLVLSLTLDKALTKQVVAAAGVHTAPFVRVRDAAQLDGVTLSYPLFVKPVAEGTSMGISEASRVANREQFERQTRWVIETYQQDALVEEFAPGREFAVGVVGNDPPEALPVIESWAPREFSTNADKTEHKKTNRCPADIPDDLAERMRRDAVTVFRALGCRDMARVDFKLDRNEQPAFLEINPLPGMSPDFSLFPIQAGVAGLDYDELIARIVDLAWERSRKRKDTKV